MVLKDKKELEKKDDPKKQQQQKPATPINSTAKTAIKKLEKESSRPKGNLDKVPKGHVQPVLERKIQSAVVLKRNCGRLINHLHQTMHHTVAIKVTQVSKLVKNGMSQRDMQKIIDTMDDIAKKHGHDFYKP